MEVPYLHVLEQPRLNAGRMVIGFSGWMDGGDVSTGTVDYIVHALGAERAAEIDPAPFYIYNMPGSMEVSALFRPHVRIEDGLITDFEEPDNAFYCDPAQNLVLFSGKEPNLAWGAYADCLLSMAEASGVTAIHFVGSVAGLVPHTRTPRFYGSVSDPALRALLDEHGLHASEYEGPASFVTYLTVRARERGIALMTLVAGIPTYVEGRNTTCIMHSVRKVSDMLGLKLNLKELEIISAAFDRKLNETVQGKPELSEQIRKIEALYDQETLDTREDDLKAWFEKQGFRTD